MAVIELSELVLLHRKRPVFGLYGPSNIFMGVTQNTSTVQHKQPNFENTGRMQGQQPDILPTPTGHLQDCMDDEQSQNEKRANNGWLTDTKLFLGHCSRLQRHKKAWLDESQQLTISCWKFRLIPCQNTDGFDRRVDGGQRSQQKTCRGQTCLQR